MDGLMITNYLKSFLGMQTHDQVGEIMKTKNVYFEYAFVAYDQHDRSTPVYSSVYYTLKRFISLSEEQRRDMLIDIISRTPDDYIGMIFRTYLEFINGIKPVIAPNAKSRYVYMCLAATELHNLKTVRNIYDNRDGIEKNHLSIGDYVYTEIVDNTIEQIGTTIYTPHKNSDEITSIVIARIHNLKKYTTDILIWLPTLDQLFDMLEDAGPFMNLRMKAFFDGTNYNKFITKIKSVAYIDNILCRAHQSYLNLIADFSPCELMLCYIMFNTYGKKWDDETKQWITVSNI